MHPKISLDYFLNPLTAQILNLPPPLFNPPPLNPSLPLILCSNNAAFREMQSRTVGPSKQLWVAYVQFFGSDAQVPKQQRKEKKEAEAMPVFWWDTAGFLRHAGTETRAISTTCRHPLLTPGMPFLNSQFYIYVSCMSVCCFRYNCCLMMCHQLLLLLYDASYYN